ncbi:hypothetical protein TELCIR_21385 [Teladorsagia circumcincta]|uniref:DUS-like FMN-binding domain-containing protein n=1 Tax=Teladorsagia circumcincta TaxID=45464 RepID=A0A2G9TGZ2_TELCI|nr:hypothetical protein TELCIR_21385 [Teladorsagia circumcincta]
MSGSNYPIPEGWKAFSARYSSGVDLNCGCPKSDVRAKGFGSFLLNKPDLLADIVKQCRSRISDPDFTIS